MQTIRRRRKFRPMFAAEKQHIEMFSVANFVLSKNYLVKKQFVLNIVLLKNWFSSSFVENTKKNAMG